MIPANAEPLLLAQQGGGGYQITRSLRFNSADSAYLSRTPASAGNRKTWTWSGWVKRSALGNQGGIFSAGTGGTNDSSIIFGDTDIIDWFNRSSGIINARLQTTNVFRDCSAWYQFVFVWNTTVATASDRMQIWVNGSRITTFITADYPAQNTDSFINSNVINYLGTQTLNTYLSGYLADIHFIDGQALTPSSFGEFDGNSVWQPKAYTGTYGTNGFYLKFADNSGTTSTTLGKDSSPNGNNWTPNNFAITSKDYRETVSSVPYSGTGAEVLNLNLTDFVRVATSNYGTSYWTVTFATPIPITSSVVCSVVSESGGSNMFRIRLNDDASTDTPLATGGVQADLTINLAGATSLSKLDFRTYSGSGVGANLYYIKVDGNIIYSGSLAGQNDSLVDSPTNYGTDTGAGGEVRGNYCTLNPLFSSTVHALSDGNLRITGTGSPSGYGITAGTIGMSSGKWYWEQTLTGVMSQDINLGIGNKDTALGNYIGATSRSYGFSSNDTKWNLSLPTSAAYTTSWVNGDIIGLAFDADAGSLTLYKNGVSLGVAFSGIPADTYFPMAAAYGTASISNLNFGQRPFAYTAPSGFKALCTQNLPTPTIAKPSTVMDTKLYTGNGTSQTISGLGFSPDLVWTKARSTNYRPQLIDIIRGGTNVLFSDGTGAEGTFQSITAFNSDGYTVSTELGVNGSGTTFAAWCWDAGSSTVTNTSGSISSQVRANASAGFSVVTYTGTGSAATVGHGLGVEPSMVVVKNRTVGADWCVWNRSVYTLNGASSLLFLNDPSAAVANATVFNGNATSTTFPVATNGATNGNGNSFVAYCFAPVAGYSAFGSYTGNGSTDGPFVYLGFRPAVVIVKMSSSTGNWTILDDKREGYNVDNDPLYPNLDVVEGTTDLIDITSNGFKVRTTDATFNTNTGTYIYAAWASSPFAYARAR